MSEPRPSEDPRALLGRAHVHHRTGDLDAARRTYRAILDDQDAPSLVRAEAALDLGRILINDGDTNGVRSLETAMELAGAIDSKGAAIVWLAAADGLARHHRRCGDDDTATATWHSGIELGASHDHDRWRVAAARCAVEARDWKAALRIGRGAEHPHGLFYAGRAAAELGSPDDVDALVAQLEHRGRPDLAQRLEQALDRSRRGGP